jgi:hypothetical protein
VQHFLASDYTTQLTKVKQKEESKGHIVANTPHEIWQFDILDLSRYARKNNNIKYLLACVDVYTRRAYVEAMPQKNAESVKTAFTTILDRANAQPQSLLSDQDGAFLGGTFGELLTQKKIILNTNALRDHHVMGIIDNFAFRIKNILTKGFLNSKNVEWIGKIQQIVDQYNSDENTALGGMSPNDADKNELPPEEKAPQGKPESPEDKKQRELRNEVRMTPYQQVLNMNLDKQKSNNQMNSLTPGDKVRVSTQGRSALQKGTDPKWSDEVFEVVRAKGDTVVLNNNQAYKRSALLRVPTETETTGANATDKEKAETLSLTQKLKQKLEKRKQQIKAKN